MPEVEPNFKEPKQPKHIPAKVRAAVKARSGGICEAQLPDICWGRAVQMDHIKNRSQGASHTVEGLQHLCVPCHQWKTTHPNEAEALGIYRRGWE